MSRYATITVIGRDRTGVVARVTNLLFDTRANIEALGVKLYLPDARTVEVCVDKKQSYHIWKDAGLKVPETIVINDEIDLRRAFDTFGETIWLRASEGGGEVL